MGCDIHVTVQKRVNGQWIDAQKFSDERGYLSPEGGEFFGDRSYALFTILANVRGEIDNPLAAHRGLPVEMSEQMREFHEGNHSATFFTVAEIMAYDWQQELPRSGWVTPDEYGKFLTRGHPDGWCGSVGGGNVVHIEPADMAHIIEATAPEKSRPHWKHHVQWAGRNGDAEGQTWLRAIEREAGGSPYCFVEWTRPFWTQGGDLFSDALPRAWPLGAPEDVRFVVSFDN